MKKQKLTILEKFICLILVFLLGLPLAHALELSRQRGVATYIAFPMINKTNTSLYAVGETVTPFYSQGNDTSAFGNFTATAANATQIQSTGIYSLALNATTMNATYITIKANSTNSLDQMILINTNLADKTGYSLAANSITSSVIATDAIGADEIAAGAITSSEAPNLDAAVSTRSTYSGGAVASVTGNVGGNVVGSVGSVTGNVTAVTNPVQINATLSY